MRSLGSVARNGIDTDCYQGLAVPRAHGKESPGGNRSGWESSRLERQSEVDAVDAGRGGVVRSGSRAQGL
jgi:hypothetical protein